MAALPPLNHLSTNATTTMDLPPKLIQLLCDFSGLVSLARKGSRRQIAERRVRPSGIIVVPPTFDSISGVVQR